MHIRAGILLCPLLTFGPALPRTLEAAAKPAVSLVLDSAAGSPARIAMQKVAAALDARKIAAERLTRIDQAHGETVVAAGLGKGTPAFVALVRDLGSELPAEPESLVVRRGTWKGRNLILVAGGDDLGLAYALYDIADRIAWTAPPADALSEVRDTRERPAVRDRSLSTYTMQQAWFETRLFDEAYWMAYFDNLVRNRFNNFSLLLGYESSGYLAPPYAWFFDLPEFPEVKAAGVTPEQQQRYTHALNRVVDLAHERGLRFTLGIWDHIYDGHSSYYTEGVWDRLPEVNGRRPRWPVEGLNEKNLIPYTQAALARFLRVVPNLDAIQFRMHGESGLGKAGMRNFWEPIFRLMAKEHPKIRFDARSKEFPSDLIELAIQLGVPLRLTTKYLAEQVGMPFHVMAMQRFDQFQSRHSYFDLLHYPQNYQIQWRLWTSGTMRLLQWGSPEYARRFADSTHLYDGDGFEVAEPLATKMASQPHIQAPIPTLNPQYRYCDYEFQRYWPYFMAFGRFAYDPATPQETWDRQFDMHFGKDAGGSVKRALERASLILPRIIAYSLPLDKFPTTRGWPERQRWEDLPDYAKAEPGDPQLFASFREDAQLRLLGGGTPKIRPEATSSWFQAAAREVLEQTAEAERRAGPRAGKEFQVTVVDLKILAHLAEYHARRIRAGVQYALFEQTGDATALDQAADWERRAIASWQELVDAAGDTYADNLALGLPEAKDRERPANDLSGHWRDELPKLRRGLDALEKLKADFRPPTRETVARLDFGPGALDPGFERAPLKRDFSIALPNGYYELKFTVAGESAGFGPMWIEAAGSERTDMFSGKAGETVERVLNAEVRNGKLDVMFAAESTGRWTARRLEVACVGPRIAHVPVRQLAPGEAAVLLATVSGPDEIRSVRVWYGDKSHGFRSAAAVPIAPFRYRASIPAPPTGVSTAYFLEAVDSKGRTATYPRDGRSQPIPLMASSDHTPPVLKHTPIATARPGSPLRILAEAADPAGVGSVRLRYRSVNQRQDYRTLEMLPTGRPNEYAAEILGDHIPAQWDLMYFFEVLDNFGNGKIYPDAEQQAPYVMVKLERGAAIANSGH